jgi:hypothetical protein
LSFGDIKSNQCVNNTIQTIAINGNRWKTDNTRWNQLRLVNEVMENPELTKSDGLSDLNFVEHNKRKLDRNIQIITVGI